MATLAKIDDVEAIGETALALLCLIDGKEVWIPQGQISDDSEVWKVGDKGTLVIPEWLAIAKELV